MNTTSDTQSDGVRSTLVAAGTMRWFHWVIVVFSLGLTLLAWNYSRNQLHARIRLQFDRDADRTVELVRERMRKYEDALWSGVAFIGTLDGNVDHQKWKRYAASIQIEQKYPGINGIGVIQSLDDSEFPAFLQRQRQERPGFTVHPPSERDEYWPITCIVPLQENAQALGLDMAHESNRITAAKKARDTGRAQVTGPIVLVQDSMKTPGFLFFAPFYQGRLHQHDTVDADRFAGLVYAPFVFRKLMKGTLAKQNRHVGIRIEDAGEVLFDEHVTSDADFDPNPLFKKTIDVAAYGRTWTFDVWSTKSFRANVDTTQPLTILAAGLIIDGLLIGLFLLISSASRKALRLADEMTRDLENLRLAADVNQIGVWDFDPNSGEVRCDDAMYRLYGHNRDTFSATYDAWLHSLHPDDRNACNAAFQNALTGESTFDCEFRIIHPSGAVRHISAKAMVFFDEAGRPVRMLGANSDITDRKHAACELESTRRLQAAIQNAAGVAIIATDPQGRIVVFNDAAQKMLGYSKDEMIDRSNPGVFHDSVEVRERASELSEEFGREVEPGFEVFVIKARQSESEQREWTYIRKDGSRFPVLLTVTALRDQDENITGYLGIAADISERKLAHERIEKANASLARSNEELAQFAYVASHDLQEPLRKVNSFCELLEQDCGNELSDDAKLYMSYIMDGGRRMRTLIQDLLAYSRVESEGRRLSRVDANETLQYAIDNLSESIRESNAQITHDTLPMAQADPGQLAQLFQNLIGNAIKYRGDNDPRVHIRGEVTGSRCIYSIEDNGIGIDLCYREQVFGVFKRLHNRSKYKGTGIGLAICKRIIDRVDGRIWIESSESGGSIFRFEIPHGLGDELNRENHLQLAACGAD
ncbi:multi-sensor signal transduction histidine kinase [Rhodopirellula maiorica SM1]|uniref:histidine kinase n=1 Tax=Rhodopirellula maiorica SM1 TaxID=1265738 RepID=M5RLP8_9BACT|nr:CHASE domain-containing protein [Rhodopirellula maiorica]EMI16287.1 multi-sensor signal transduction histidine kinase [Rhodopirellula maiorica SM1]